jgi:hypothetical protein
VEREGQAGVGEGQLACRGIEHSVEGGAEAAWKWALQEALVEKREDRGGVDAGLVDAPKSTHDERAIHGGGKSLANDVTEVETDPSIGQAEEIDEVSADLEEGSEAECDLDRVIAQRRGWDERRLNETSLSDVLTADAAAGRGFQVLDRFAFGEEVDEMQGVIVLCTLDRQEVRWA